MAMACSTSDGAPVVSFKALYTFALSLGILSWPRVSKPREAHRRMRDHVEESLIIPTEAVLEPAYSQLTPNTGAAQSRSAELPTQESTADCRHTMSTDKSRRTTELIHRLINNNKCSLLSH